MDAFSQQDLIGRQKTTKLFPKYEMVASADRYSVWDMSGMTQNIAGDLNPYLIEIKDRNVSSTEYGTVLMEFKKYKSLLKLAAENQIEDVFYINHYTDRVTYVFNLKNIKAYNLNLVVKKAPLTTKGTTNYVDKIFVELDVQQGKKYHNSK